MHVLISRGDRIFREARLQKGHRVSGSLSACSQIDLSARSFVRYVHLAMH